MKGRKCVTPRVTRSLNVLHTNPLCYAQFSRKRESSTFRHIEQSKRYLSQFLALAAQNSFSYEEKGIG